MSVVLPQCAHSWWSHSLPVGYGSVLLSKDPVNRADLYLCRLWALKDCSLSLLNFFQLKEFYSGTAIVTCLSQSKLFRNSVSNFNCYWLLETLLIIPMESNLSLNCACFNILYLLKSKSRMWHYGCFCSMVDTFQLFCAVWDGMKKATVIYAGYKSVLFLYTFQRFQVTCQPIN